MFRLFFTALLVTTGALVLAGGPPASQSGDQFLDGIGEGESGSPCSVITGLPVPASRTDSVMPSPTVIERCADCTA